MTLKTAGLSVVAAIIVAMSLNTQPCNALEPASAAVEKPPAGMAMGHDHHMGTSAPVTYSELENTAACPTSHGKVS